MFAIWNWNLFNVSKDVKQNAKHLLNIVSKEKQKDRGIRILHNFSFLLSLYGSIQLKFPKEREFSFQWNFKKLNINNIQPMNRAFISTLNLSFSPLKLNRSKSCSYPINEEINKLNGNKLTNAEHVESRIQY